MRTDLTSKERELRNAFPLLKNSTLAYLDNGATSQKPQAVIDAVAKYYEHDNANPMRGLYDLSIRSTEIYEEARAKVAKFIHAPKAEEIVFTRNASESLNLIAYSYGMHFLKEGDEILVGITEHHSNFLPWQQVGKVTKAKVNFLECANDGEISIDAFRAALTPNTKLVAITQVSNVLGRENPVKEFAKIAHEQGAVIVVDGSQSIPHMPVNVSDIDADFFVFSGHKMFAPMGIGVLYGKMELLDKMPPFLYGGEMIETVSKEKATFAEVPHKFEAGTVNAGGARGLSAAIDFMENVGFETIMQREDMLTKIVMEKLQKYPYVHILGSKDPSEHHGIISFTVDGVHPHDISEILSSDDIAIRAGHHCAQPLLTHLGIMSSARASFAYYNTEAEARRFVESVITLRKRMGYGE
jgi:cysteine desulfurase, sufS subfamily